MNCTMNFPITPFSVIWTLDCDDPTLLGDHHLYKGRVNFHFFNRQITILNVTEQDSRIYCCHVETADGKRKSGNGTWLEVTKKVEGKPQFTITLGPPPACNRAPTFHVWFIILVASYIAEARWLTVTDHIGEIEDYFFSSSNNDTTRLMVSVHTCRHRDLVVKIHSWWYETIECSGT